MTHFAPRAKRVIFLFMNGAPSHVDTFDPKPALKKHAGQAPTDKVKKNAGGVPTFAVQLPPPRTEWCRDERAVPAALALCG